MTKRIVLILAILMATVCSVQAAQVNKADARQVADRFFSSRSPRFSGPSGQAATRLAYTAEQDRFYVFDRGNHGGFVVVAGDDRLPQVLGYGDKGDFTASELPPAVQYWMDEMNRQIAFLQSHDGVAAHHPAMRATHVEPLMTTFWDQGAPYNNFCPTYTDNKGNTNRAVTGCVATAVAQVMNYYKWPDVGQGSHSYNCNVNDMTPTELSADFSQSVYQWDLMLDWYDTNSSQESCDAVAKLMSDVGISMDMGYGSSSGANEDRAMRAMQRYFKYSDRSYLMNRDLYSAEEWDQFLVDEISARRPVVYCGYAITSTDAGGHAFVLDGFDAQGYFHVNWGWGGSYDGYFLVSYLAPSSSNNFKYMQDGLFGVIPAPRAGEVEDALHIRSQLVPQTPTVQLGANASFMLDMMAEGNALDTAGYDEYNGRKHYYALIPLKLGIYDNNGVERQHMELNYRQSLDNGMWSSGQSMDIELLNSLEDGEYKVKVFYSLDEGETYNKVLDYSGKEVYVKMIVSEGTAYLMDCFLANTYSMGSFDLPGNITINEPFEVDVHMSYDTWGYHVGPVGNVYLSLLKDGNEVATSDLYEVQISSNEEKTYRMQLTAPAQWGAYDLVLKDESGNEMMIEDGWYDRYVVTAPVFVLPVCEALVEDFETMTANSSTSDKNVQGQFATWSFTKCGVRAPGEERCNGINSVMMKKPSALYTTQALEHNFLLAQATFFNPATPAAKYTLEYSYDGGATWQKANTIDQLDAAEVPEKSKATVRWMLNLLPSKPVNFRIAMTGGGAASTYVDDICFYYLDTLGDVNLDGEINVADINAVIDIILMGGMRNAADVNQDEEVNIADVNTLIDMILGGD